MKHHIRSIAVLLALAVTGGAFAASFERKETLKGGK